MRVPSYRKHSSGQARVTINGKDHMLGKYGSAASKEAYGRLIAEFNASNGSASFGKDPDAIRMEDVLLAYLRHAKIYYKDSTEYANLKLVVRPLVELYGRGSASTFGAAEFKAVRAWWLTPSPPKVGKDGEEIPDLGRSRQYVNKQMKRTVQVWESRRHKC